VYLKGVRSKDAATKVNSGELRRWSPESTANEKSHRRGGFFKYPGFDYRTSKTSTDPHSQFRVFGQSARISESMVAPLSLRARRIRRFLQDLKQRIRTAQIKAVFAVNRELILLYWQVAARS